MLQQPALARELQALRPVPVHEHPDELVVDRSCGLNLGYLRALCHHVSHLVAPLLQASDQPNLT
ncbi:hypothetical protein GCM10010349_77510 [Streptomyces flavofungini]|nr:hypothetical protein GCM10010349_77510 [Streptomyces flavofungini]